MAGAIARFFRKLFQFVLGLLIVLVVLSLALWFITAKWGATQLAKSLADEPSETSYIEIKRGDQVTRIQCRRSSEVVGAASSPAPLIVIWRPDSRHVNEYTMYFWFFGYTRQLYKTPIQADEAPIQINHENNETNEKKAN